jgi:hypothetical protein
MVVILLIIKEGEEMAYKDCPDCGCRVYNGLCTNCDEESYIFEQGSKNEEHVDFDDEFMGKVYEQHGKAYPSKQ